MTPAIVATSTLADGPTAPATTTFVPVPARIEAHAATTPHRVAVEDSDTTVTYGELDEWADRLARTLRACGAGPGCCVALLLPRSARFVVAAHAVLKTGAAYLPLDPATPTDRVHYILGDAGASIVLSDHSRPEAVPRGPWVELELDDDAGAAPTAPVARSPEPVAGSPTGRERSAYVIYTSGSTGRPKGVEITHANLAHLVDWHNAAFAVTDEDRASQVAGLGFDAAVWEIWPALAAGASLHVADEGTHRSPQLLQDWLVAQEITIAFAPTLLAEQLMAAEWPERTALRTLLTGAERLNRRPLPGLPFTVVNNYGPTECTVVATSGPVAPEGDHPGPPSIGRPLPGTVAMLLDESLRPVGDDEPGELVLAGPHVGRGYRNDPQRTAERFVTVRADDGTSLRAYRTGDRVRRLADGRLVFLGRLDDQVKVRGYRIEPAEIVGWLQRCPGVGAGTVTVTGSSDSADENARELVAYIVPVGEQAPSAAQVRSFLAAQLPDYMVPAHVVTLAALPTTPNGKLDTAALPRPDATPEQAPHEAPSDVQAWLQGMLAELLKLPEVGVDDNIFLLGGHSMLAMQVISRVRQRYEVKLPLRQLFRGPTVSAMAAEVVRQQEVGA
jgi:amino acid adenylation domain-containing protein